MNIRTFKGAKYQGPGDPLSEYVLGAHVGAGSPFFRYPLFPNVRDSVLWMRRDYRESGYVEAEFTATKTNSGAITPNSDGLDLVTGATSGNNTTAQFIRATPAPAAGAVAGFYFRLHLDDITKGTMWAGFWSAQADPLGTPPVDGFFFKKTTTGTGVITALTGAASTFTTSGTIGTLVNAVAQEFAGIMVWSSASAGTAYFYHRAIGGAWDAAVTSITNIPANALRFGLNHNASSSNAITATFEDYHFWWSE